MKDRLAVPYIDEEQGEERNERVSETGELTETGEREKTIGKGETAQLRNGSMINTISLPLANAQHK